MVVVVQGIMGKAAAQRTAKGKGRASMGGRGRIGIAVVVMVGGIGITLRLRLGGGAIFGDFYCSLFGFLLLRDIHSFVVGV